MSSWCALETPDQIQHLRTDKRRQREILGELVQVCEGGRLRELGGDLVEARLVRRRTGDPRRRKDGLDLGAQLTREIGVPQRLGAIDQLVQLRRPVPRLDVARGGSSPPGSLFEDPIARVGRLDPHS